MDTKQLKAFLTVATLKNYTQAAQELYISQPALSYQITSLEREIGVTLFDRNGRRVVLTESGVQLYDGAKQLLDIWNDLCLQVVETEAKKRIPLLNIGYPDNFFNTKLYDLMGTFKRRHSDVSFMISNLEFSGIETALENGTVDIVFTHGLLEWPTDCECKVLSRSQMTLVVSEAFLSSHGLNSDASCEEVLNLKNVKVFILGGFQRGVQEVTVLARNAFTHKPEFVLHRNYLTMLHNVALGVGVTMLPEPVAKLVPIESNILMALPETLPQKEANYCAIWQKGNQSQILHTFLDFLDEAPGMD